MSGGKGGSQTTTSQVQIPPYIEEASKQNLARANEISQLGYTPYYGPDVAAFTPMQEAAFQGTNQAASAFGMPSVDYSMPQATEYAGGIRGYSSAPMYEQSMGALQTNAPAQYDFIRSMFINPVSGDLPQTPFGQGGSIYPPDPETQAAQAAAAQAAAAQTAAPTPSYQLTKREAQAGLTPQMKARGMTIADVWGP